nr:glycosyltransferase [Spiribacter salilacus]
MGIELPFLVKWPDKKLRSLISGSVYGIGLYEAIRDTKAVLNTFGDLNIRFHSNMRVFETIGNGTPLISPKGVYPEGLEEGLDYLSFSSVDDISRIMKSFIYEPDQALAFAETARARVLRNFSKQRQYSEFLNFVSKL